MDEPVKPGDVTAVLAALACILFAIKSCEQSLEKYEWQEQRVTIVGEK